MVGPRGFGPLTPVLSGLCSNQLSYGPNLPVSYIGNALIHYLPADRQADLPSGRLHNKSEALCSLLIITRERLPIQKNNSQALRVVKRSRIKLQTQNSNILAKQKILERR